MTDAKPDLQAIFNEAIARDSREERAKYLDVACANEPQARARVEALLRAHSEAGGFFGGQLQATEIEPITEKPGSWIGPYKLLQQIGDGGMGVVYMAEQKQPVKRRVALKIIKPGMDTRQVIARFEAERQALALMDHPNIAKVLDAGQTESGRPYFVMELVNGLPVTKYCDEQHLTPKERLELFVPICQAVQHAHQKGIIHRDLKPSNILVAPYDGQPVPKVIDFGVAKATTQTLTDKTMFTQLGQVVGTLEYMSPEQAERNQLDIDTRSDIYSLGVVLYELLTGEMPFDRERLRSAAFEEMLRIIREEEPSKPSTKVSSSQSLPSIAANRRIEPAKLGSMFRGELDWIVLKALEKDRARRYETANGLANDIERYLVNETVEACPPSAAYRFRKFARRNRVALMTGALVAAALVVGTAASTWQAIRATRAERLSEERLVAETRARTEADTARAAEAEQRRLAESERAIAEQQRAAAEANFQMARETVDEYFTLVSEDKLLNVPGLQPLRKDLLESAIRFYEGSAAERADDPAVLVDLAASYLRVAIVYYLMDRNDDAVSSVDKALDVIEDLEQDFPDAREQRRELGGFWTGFRPTTQGTDLPQDEGAAFQILMRLNATWQALADEFPAEYGFRSDLAANYSLIGDLLATGGQHREGIHYFQRSKEILQQLTHDAPDNPEYRFDLARTHQHLDQSLGRVERDDEAEAESRAALELLEALVAEFPDSPQYRAALGSRLTYFLKYEPAHDTTEAAKIVRRAVEQYETLVQDYPNVELYRVHLVDTHKSFAKYLRRAGRFEEAAQVLARIDENYVGDDPYELAMLYVQAKLFDPYRRLCQTVVNRTSMSDNISDWSNAGVVCKQAPNALPDYTPVLKLLENAVDREPDNRLFRSVQAHLLYRAGNAALAAENLELLASTDEAGSIHEPFDKLFLAMSHHDLGNKAEAERYFREAAEWIDNNGQAELTDKAVLSEPLNSNLRDELQLLRTEAEQLLGSTQTPPGIPSDHAL